MSAPAATVEPLARIRYTPRRRDVFRRRAAVYLDARRRQRSIALSLGLAAAGLVASGGTVVAGVVADQPVAAVFGLLGAGLAIARLVTIPAVLLTLAVRVARTPIDDVRVDLVDDALRWSSRGYSGQIGLDRVTGVDHRHGETWIRIAGDAVVFVPHDGLAEGDSGAFLATLDLLRKTAKASPAPAVVVAPATSSAGSGGVGGPAAGGSAGVDAWAAPGDGATLEYRGDADLAWRPSAGRALRNALWRSLGLLRPGQLAMRLAPVALWPVLVWAALGVAKVHALKLSAAVVVGLGALGALSMLSPLLGTATALVRDPQRLLGAPGSIVEIWRTEDAVRLRHGAVEASYPLARLQGVRRTPTDWIVDFGDVALLLPRTGLLHGDSDAVVRSMKDARG